MFDKLLCLFFIFALVFGSGLCQDVCQLPQETGPCRASITKYGYNKVEGKCTKFTYGGCQGNGNNFDALEQCQEMCEYMYTVGPVVD